MYAALYGAWRLARLDPRGQDHFDASITGFWRSFQAAVIVAPAFVFLILFNLDQPNITAGALRLTLVESLAYIISWTAFPLAMVALAHRLNRDQNYIRFIVAHNWANVLQVAVFLPTAIIAQVVGPSARFLTVAAMVAIFLYQWYVARTVLSINPFQAIGIVLVNLFIDIIITLIANGMVIGPD
ncbi:MAG: hypothetical protein V3T02_07695 [Alphaproteobacteria bacterium]